jgi:hypothetical protein
LLFPIISETTHTDNLECTIRVVAALVILPIWLLFILQLGRLPIIDALNDDDRGLIVVGASHRPHWPRCPLQMAAFLICKLAPLLFCQIAAADYACLGIPIVWLGERRIAIADKNGKRYG